MLIGIVVGILIVAILIINVSKTSQDILGGLNLSWGSSLLKPDVLKPLKNILIFQYQGYEEIIL